MLRESITRRAFSATPIVALAATRTLHAQRLGVLNRTILHGHVHDLLESMAAIEDNRVRPAHLYNVARSHELVFEHFEDIGLNGQLQQTVRMYPEKLIYPELDSAIPAMQAAWKSYGRNMTRDEILAPINRTVPGDRAQLAEFISKEGLSELAKQTAERIRSSAAALRAGLNRGVRLVNADNNTTVPLRYPFLAGSNQQAYNIIGSGLVLLSGIYYTAPYLLPAVAICPVCTVASIVFLIAGGAVLLYANLIA